MLLLTGWLPDNVFFLKLRGRLVRPFFGSCGENFRLGRKTTFYNPELINIGSNVYIAFGCWILAAGVVELEDEVMFGPYCVVSAGNHTRVNGSFRFGPAETLPIRIGRGSWIGANSTVLGGCEIGSGCLIGSNSSVPRGIIPDNSLVVGVPGKVKKLLD